MANDPRLFLRPGCRRDSQYKQNQAQQRKSFIDSLSNVGNLEFANDAGLGGITQGLRTLASVSDSVRTGQSQVPGREGDELFNSTLGQIANTGLDAVEQGANTVLSTTGIDPGSANQALQFNSDVVNRAYGQAQQIFQDVKNGRFSLENIPQVFQDLQNLEQLIRGIRTEQPRQKRELCTASPYARELIRYAPKHKFMFVVDVEFSPPYKEWDPYGDGMAFVVKRSTRPQVEFEYEEVNMYNFWTKVPKRTMFQPVTVTFYDDNKNYAQLFHTAYLRAMSPITNLRFEQKVQGSGYYEDNSMNFANELRGGTFADGDPATRGYSASLGALNDNAKTVLNEIRLFHLFDYGRLANIYHFYNPKINSFTPDDLNMAETGDGNEMEFNFSYDGLFVEPGYSIKNSDGSVDIAQLTGEDGRAERYYIDPIFADDNVTSHAAPVSQEQVPNITTAEEVLNSTTGENTSSTGLDNDSFRRESNSGSFPGR